MAPTATVEDLDEAGKRNVRYNDPTAEPHKGYSDNVVRTAKFNIITFVPIFLFEVFRKASYFYFLVMAILAWIPEISPYSGK